MGMKDGGIDFAASVPCINLQELLTMVEADPEIRFVPVTREEEGVGICAGAFLGGLRPALLMQNSGLGNSINALASLDQLYGLPLLMIISHRGSSGEKISGQIPMGRLTAPLLDALGIPSWTPRPQQARSFVAHAAAAAWERGTLAAVLLDLDFWKGI